MALYRPDALAAAPPAGFAAECHSLARKADNMRLLLAACAALGAPAVVSALDIALVSERMKPLILLWSPPACPPA